MSRDPFDSGEEMADERIIRRRTRRTGEVMSRLCSSWIRAYADVFVGSIRVTGDVAEGLSDTYCDRENRGPRD